MEEIPRDDAALARWVQEGRPEAVAALSDRYRERLVARAQRVLGDPHEAEDVVQEVFLRAPRARELRDAKSLPGWLFALSYRLAVDRLRSRRRRQHAVEALALSPRGSAEPAASQLERSEEEARVRGAVEGLGEPYRQAIRLRYLDGLEFAEIAARLRTIERTARTWVGRGLNTLRERLREEGA